MTCVEGAGRLSIHELIGCSSIASAQLDTILISVSALLFLDYPQSHFPWSAVLGPSQSETLQTDSPQVQIPCPRSWVHSPPSDPLPPPHPRFWVHSPPSSGRQGFSGGSRAAKIPALFLSVRVPASCRESCRLCCPVLDTVKR